METLPMLSSCLIDRLVLNVLRDNSKRKTLSEPCDGVDVRQRTPGQRPTMLDVAALAGVGLATVSRVVNGKPGVSPATTDRVLAAIEQLDYRHDVHASNLRRSDRKTATIGLVLEDVANPFMSALHRAVEDSARARGMLVFAGSCDEDGGREREFISALRARRVDGIIVVPASGDHSYLLPEIRVGTAIVFVDRPPRFLDADSVTSDDHGGTLMAVSHLVKRGHRRIAYLGADLAIATAQERLRGYTDGLSAHRLAFDPAAVRTGLRSVEDAERAAAEILGDGNAPTALVSGQNYFTIGAYKALRSLGLLRQVALIGFDDFSLAEMLDPPVTVVAHDAVELGRTAAQLLLRRLDGDRSASEHIVCPVHLIPRGSGEIEPAS
jgi:LacI family transcriptional regulator, galactose operon repressor